MVKTKEQVVQELAEYKTHYKAQKTLIEYLETQLSYYERKRNRIQITPELIVIADELEKLYRRLFDVFKSTHATSVGKETGSIVNDLHGLKLKVGNLVKKIEIKSKGAA